jgi:malate dehydrogenase
MLNSDVVVVSASVPLRINSSRLVFLNDNAAIINRISDLLIKADTDWHGVLLIVANPVDPLCIWVQRCTGFNRRRFLGYTLNDSLRLRTGIGQVLGAAPQNIDAWVIVEHGDFCVPLFSRVTLDGGPVELTAEKRQRAEEFLRS